MDYDLYCENWRRKRNYEPYNGEFRHLSKSIEEWNDMRSNYIEAKAETNSLASNRPNTLEDGTSGYENTEKHSFDPKPWDTVKSYPENWEGLDFYVFDIHITSNNLATLMENEEIDDMIINSFLKICKYENTTKEPLVFDVFFF